MPFQHLEFLTVLKANDVIWVDRFLDRNGGLWAFCWCCRNVPDISQGIVHLVDQLRQISHCHRIVRNMGRDDLRRQRQQVAVLVWVVHLGDPAVSLISEYN